MKVFQHEVDAGLAPAIFGSKSVAFLVPLKAEQSKLSDAELVQANLLIQKASAKDNQATASVDDLFVFDSIFVSTGWNKNDDVFEKSEVWQARHTPLHKRLNIEHYERDIVGHIISAYAVDSALAILSDDLSINDVPNKFHLMTRACIYKMWEDAYQEQKVSRIIELIKQGQLYVSMEAWFTGFDYGMMDEAGTTYIIARNEQTSFLTKCLKFYGGTGAYQGNRIGRVLRGVTFAGKGIVETPANPESVIFANEISEIIPSKANQVYNSLSELIFTKGGYTMTEMELVQKQLNEVKAALKSAEDEKAKLQSTLAEIADKNYQSKIEKLQTGLKAAEDTNAKLGEQIKVLSDAKAAVEKQAADSVKELAETKDSLAKMVAAEVKRRRIAKTISTLEMEEADATELVVSCVAMDDSAFDKFVVSIAKKLPAKAAAKTPEQVIDDANKTAERKPALPVEQSIDDELAKSIAAFLGNGEEK